MATISPQRRMMAVFLIASIGFSANAEIEKHAVATDKGLQFYWWPKLKPSKGWVHHRELSEQMSANVLLPVGKNYDNARTVIYARAFYEPDPKKRGTLKEFIEGDIAGMRNHDRSFVVKEVSSMRTASGKSLRTFSFVVPGKSNELVAYGAEGDYWIMFVATSQTPDGLDKDRPTFSQVVASYR